MVEYRKVPLEDFGPSGSSQCVRPFSRKLRTPCHFHIKNHGPEPVRLFAEQGVRMDLPAGIVHATYAAGAITVENKSETRVLIEFDLFADLPK